MTTQQTIDTLCALLDLGAWIDQMPEVPSRHGADAMCETYWNCVEQAIDDNVELGNAIEYATNSEDWDGTEAHKFRIAAAALEIELTR